MFTTQDRSARLKCKPRCTDGRATLTIDASSTTMNWATAARPNTAQGLIERTDPGAGRASSVLMGTPLSADSVSTSKCPLFLAPVYFSRNRAPGCEATDATENHVGDFR